MLDYGKEVRYTRYLRFVVILAIVTVLGFGSRSLTAYASSVESFVSERSDVLVRGDIEVPQENQEESNFTKIIPKTVSVNRDAGSTTTAGIKKTNQRVLPHLGDKDKNFFLISFVLVLCLFILKRLEGEREC